MDLFLAVLNPSVREKTEEALALDGGEARLRRVAGRYIDEEGRWPVDPTTADYLARSFIRQSEFAMPRFGSSGLREITLAGMAGKTISLLAGKGLIAAGEGFMGKYWAEMASVATGVHPAVFKGIRSSANFMNEYTDWVAITRAMTEGFSRKVWNEEFTTNYEKRIMQDIAGDIANVAWRGSRTASYHTDGQTQDKSVNTWVNNYVQRVARSQAELSERTARHIVDELVLEGRPPNVVARKLRQMWPLTPSGVDSANKYRQRLSAQDRTTSWVNRMTERYVIRTRDQRFRTFAKTESHTAFNLGREAEWMRSVGQGVLPGDTMKMWITGRDEAVCEVCAPMDGKIAPLGEIFEDINLYVPAVHPNCRCITIPVQTGVANADDPVLVFPVYDVVEKHLKGKHDQKDHGSWVERRIKGKNEDFSDKKLKEIEESVQGRTYTETTNNIIAFLKSWNKKSNVEITLNLSRGNKIISINLGEEHSTVSNHSSNYESGLRGYTTFHNHPSGDFEKAVSAPSGTDILGALLTSTKSVIVNDLGVYTLDARKNDFNVYDFNADDEADLKSIPQTYLGLSGILDNFLEESSTRALARMIVSHPGILEDEKLLTSPESNQEFNQLLGEYYWRNLPRVLPKEVNASFRFKPWDEVSKRTVTVEEYTRADGTVVEEHERKIDPAKGASGFSVGNANFFVEDKLDTGDVLTGVVATAIGAGIGWYVPIGLKQHVASLGGRGAPLSRDTFSSYREARRLDASYKRSNSLREMTELGEELRGLGFNIENTRHTTNLWKKSVQNTPGTTRNIDENTPRNIAARAGAHFHGSAFSNPFTRGIHDAAQRVFRLTDAATSHFKPHTDASRLAANNAFGGTNGSGYDALVRAQYEATQRHLRANGITQMPLVRGVKGSRQQAEEMGIPVITEIPKPGESVWRMTTSDLQPLNSVTPNPNIAARFSSGVTNWPDHIPSGDRVSFIYRRVASSDEVYSTHSTGMGMDTWDEWVLLGGRQKWEVVAIDPSLLTPEATAGWNLGRRAQRNLEAIWDSGL